jgi:hypothetical protein
VHDADVARAALLLGGGPVVDLHGFGLARIGTTLLNPHVNVGKSTPCT